MAFSGMMQLFQTLPDDATMKDRLETYQDTLKHLGLLPATRETPYPNFYERKSAERTGRIALTRAEVETLTGAMSDLAALRGRTMEEGWQRLPASIQHLAVRLTNAAPRDSRGRLTLIQFQRRDAEAVLRALVDLSNFMLKQLASGVEVRIHGASNKRDSRRIILERRDAAQALLDKLIG